MQTRRFLAGVFVFFLMLAGGVAWSDWTCTADGCFPTTSVPMPAAPIAAGNCSGSAGSCAGGLLMRAGPIRRLRQRRLNVRHHRRAARRAAFRSCGG